MNNEQLKEILAKMQKRLDLVTLGLLLVFLVTAGYMTIWERNYILPEVPEPSRNQWAVKLPIQGFGDNVQGEAVEAVKRIQERFINVQPNINEDPDARRLIANNMFDLKAVTEAAAAREELNREYNRAEALFNQRQLDEALRIVNSILERDPAHAEARDLRRQIEAQRAATPTAPPPA